MKNGPNYNSDFATTGYEDEELPPDTKRVHVPEYILQAAHDMPAPETLPPGDVESPPSDRFLVTEDMFVH